MLVIGVGNPGRGDDAAGVLVARLLLARRVPGLEVIVCGGEAGTLLEAWRGHAEVRVVDAMSGAGPPGCLRRYDVATSPLPACFRPGSTHSFGLAAAVELARALRALPRHLVVHGIEGRAFGPGQPVSPEVRRAVEQTVELILRGVHGNGRSAA